MIYALILCTTLYGERPSCRFTNPPMIFETEAECRQAMKPLGKPNANGRIVISDGDIKSWWQCMHKHEEPWT